LIDGLNSVMKLFSQDYIIPPNEFSSIFIMTNFLKTEQSQGFCDEVISLLI